MTNSYSKVISLLVFVAIVVWAIMSIGHSSKNAPIEWRFFSIALPLSLGYFLASWWDYFPNFGYEKDLENNPLEEESLLP